MRFTILLLALVVLAAGCITSSPDTDADATSEADERATEGINQTLYLTGERGLTPAEATGEPESVPAGSFYTAWAQGEEQPTWSGQPLGQPIVAESAELTFYYTAETTTVTTGPQDQGFPEFVVYFGTEASPAAWASLEGPDVVQEGQTVEITAELNLPDGGLFVPASVEPVVKLAPVQGQGSAEDTRIEFLVNGSQTPSRVEIGGYAAQMPEHGSTPVVEDTDVLAGSAYALGAEEGASARSYPVEVGEDTLGLDARLERQTGAGIADIDLQLLGPDGEVAAQSVTPEDDEGLTLRQNNVDAIGEGTWTLRVVNYGNAAVEYSLDAEVLEPVG